MPVADKSDERLLVKPWIVEVANFDPVVYYAHSPGAARAECWRGYTVCHDIPFSRFLLISRVRKGVPGDGYGDKIFVQGKPAYRIPHVFPPNLNVRFCWPNDKRVLISHPRDVSTPLTVEQWERGEPPVFIEDAAIATLAASDIRYAGDLRRFVMESNRIEGINREPTVTELDAHTEFLDAEFVEPSDIIDALETFVAYVQPGAVLRRKEGMNVRVRDHVAPKGGPFMYGMLHTILADTSLSPYERHCKYLTLHPFMDGNGRSARVMWLKDMGGLEEVPLGFLHTFYYQTLSASEGRKQP